LKKSLFFIFLFLATCACLFAFGTQEAQVVTQNNDWTLCITDFDISSLSSDKQIIKGLIVMRFAQRLGSINYRTRVSPEYAWYEEDAFTRERSTAARALAAKREERSNLLYRGDPQWRYRQNLQRVDADIERLTTALNEIENNMPLINREPAFNLVSANRNNTFPPAPEAGAEHRFCTSMRIDSFLTGVISEFHGRFLLSIKLYAFYTRSYIWEESILFSAEDIDEAVDEVINRLMSVVSGNRPSALSVNAHPESTLVLINQSFAGRGAVDSYEYPGGAILITASAPDHERITHETTLSPGELAEITLNLNPIRYGTIDITSPEQASVYHGAMFVGETPVTLRLPINQLDYIELIANNRNNGRAVFQMPDDDGFSGSLSVRTSAPQPSGRVDNARNMFYWGWGGSWITGIAAWLSYYTFTGMNSVQIRSPDFLEQRNLMNYISIGTMITVGAAAVYGIGSLIYYIYTANLDAAPIIQANGN